MEEEIQTEKKSLWWLWLIIILVLILLAICAYFLFFSEKKISSLERENKGSFPPSSTLVRTEDAPNGETISCQDPDGYDLNTAGETKHVYAENSGSTNGQEDYCDFTNSVKGVLREGYCEGIKFKIDIIKCGEGYVCRAGKCIAGDESLSRCVDSDGGNNAVTKGKIASPGGSGEDTCYMTGSNTNECSGAGCKVYEYYCDGEIKAYEEIACQNGCRNGACL